MSTVFRTALETHIEQLKERINGANPGQIAEELRLTQALFDRTKDGRVKRSLGNSIRRLELAQADAGNSDTLRKILTAAQNLQAAIKDRPEYNKKRPRTPRAANATPTPRRVRRRPA